MNRNVDDAALAAILAGQFMAGLIGETAQVVTAVAMLVTAMGGLLLAIQRMREGRKDR